MIGRILREYLPQVYFAGLEVKKKIASTFQSDKPYITDSLGGSFKAYLHNGNKAQIIGKLKNGMDEESCRTIDVLVERFLTYPDENGDTGATIPPHPVGGFLPVEEESQRREVVGAMTELKNKFVLTPEVYEESVFYHLHGLRHVPQSVKQSLKGKDFIDCGAYIGDSAISLSTFRYEKIYSIEMSKKSIARYQANMKENQIGKHKYEIIEMGVASQDDLKPLVLPDTGSAGFSLFRKNSKYDHIQVDQKSLDYIVRSYGIHPSFIKADIEGAAYKMVKGGVRTFTDHRPVFSIAIYHNPWEFFEIKPFLEAILQDYTFLIRKLESSTHRNHCHSEVVLIGYPNELIRNSNHL